VVTIPLNGERRVHARRVCDGRLTICGQPIKEMAQTTQMLNWLSFSAVFIHLEQFPFKPGSYAAQPASSTIAPTDNSDFGRNAMAGLASMSSAKSSSGYAEVRMTFCPL